MRIAPFELERFFAAHEFTVPHLMCASDCQSITIGELMSWEPGSREDFDNLSLGYTESKGNPELRSSIADTYHNIKIDEVLVHSGAEEAIFVFMNSQLKAGDHVIVHWPCYESLYRVAESIGCEVTQWHADPKKGWDLDVNFLKKAIKKNTKLVVLNSPHNPTGYLLPKEKLKEVVSLVQPQGILLFCDEVYRGLEHNPLERAPAVCDIYENGISLGVMSKVYGLAGLRIGWVATKNNSVIEEMAHFKHYTTICNSAPSEFLSCLALKHGDRLIQKNLKIISDNLVLLDKFFDNYSHRFTWHRPKAGCIAFPEVISGIDSDEFCAKALKSAGVLLAPSSRFGYSNKHFRIGFGRDPFRRGLSALCQWLDSLK
jgi:aspartate/methionine/tyrosine aminotransferase